MISSYSADTNSLSHNEADQLQDLIDKARFFDIPTEESSRPPAGAADYFEYVITVEKEGQQQPHTVKTTDVTMPPGLRPLINFLISKKTKSS